MIKQLFVPACAAILIWTGIATSAAAQDETPTAITDQNRAGDLPFSAVVGSNLEHVVVSSPADLTINIPIADVPGRGGHFHFGLRYDGRFMVAAQRGSTYIWNIERGNYLPTAGLWQSNIPLVTYTTYTKTTCASMVPGNINGTNNFSYSDSSGAGHTLLAGHEFGTCNDLGSWKYVNRGPDTSGAGMWSGGLAILHSQVGPGPVGLFLADGSQPGNTGTNGTDPTTSTVQNIFGSIQDPNGNFQSEFPGGDDTLGRILISEQDLTNQIVYTVKDSSGTAQTYTVNLTGLAINTAFGITGVQEYVGTRSVISSVVLPNGREL